MSLDLIIVYSVHLNQESINEIYIGRKKYYFLLTNQNSSRFLNFKCFADLERLVQYPTIPQQIISNNSPILKSGNFTFTIESIPEKYFQFFIFEDRCLPKTLYYPSKMSMKFNGVCESRFRPSF